MKLLQVEEAEYGYPNSSVPLFFQFDSCFLDFKLLSKRSSFNLLLPPLERFYAVEVLVVRGVSVPKNHQQGRA